MLDYDPVASDPAVEDDTKGKNTQLVTRFKGWYHYHPDLANLPPSAIPIQLSSYTKGGPRRARRVFKPLGTTPFAETQQAGRRRAQRRRRVPRSATDRSPAQKSHRGTCCAVDKSPIIIPVPPRGNFSLGLWLAESPVTQPQTRPQSSQGRRKTRQDHRQYLYHHHYHYLYHYNCHYR